MSGAPAIGDHPQVGNAGYVPSRVRRMYGPKATDGGPVHRNIRRLKAGAGYFQRIHQKLTKIGSDMELNRDKLDREALERKQERHPQETHFV